MAVYPTKSSKKNLRNKRFQFGLSLTIFFSILMLFLIFNFIEIFTITLIGTFGLLLYPLSIFFIVIGIMLMLNKPVRTSKSIVILSIVWLCLFTLVFQMITSKNIDSSFSDYMRTTFKENLTAGGVLFGVLLYPLYYFTYNVAVYVILAIGLVAITAFLIDKIYLEIKNAPKKSVVAENNETDENTNIDEDYEEEIPLRVTNNIRVEEEDIIIPDESEEESQKAKALSELGMIKKEEHIDTLQNYKEKLESQNTFNNFNYDNNSKKPNIFVHEDDALDTPAMIIDKEKKALEDKKKKEDDKREAALKYLRITNGNFQSKNKETIVDNVTPKKDVSKLFEQKEENTKRISNLNNMINNMGNNKREISGGFNPFKEQEKPKQIDIYDPNLSRDSFNSGYRSDLPEKARGIYTGEVNDNIVESNGPRPVQITIEDPVKRPKPTKKIYTKPPTYEKPPITLLKEYPTVIAQDEDMQEKGNLIVETLKAFKIETRIINAVKGPTFTRYELQMAPGISVNTINGKINDLSMALESQCRVQVPIPGKNAFGIEVPNKNRMIVGLREILESQNFQTNKSPLTFALGKDIAGDCKVACIDKLVHTLVAGGTNSGKSVCLSSMLISLLYKASPEDLRLILVDPKTVEFSLFNNLPHMLIPNTITECDKAIMALDWLVDEMERRYKQLNMLGVKKISEYNETDEVRTGAVQKMYYIVLVFDEVGDFMARAKKEIEEKIILLAAKARACGIHIVLATQRPTVDVITGTIKTNLPSRIAFAVSSYNDSKTILENSGAEYLLGLGDMLFVPQGSNELARIQGCLVTNNEIKSVIQYIKDHNEAIFDDEIEDQMFNKQEGFDPTNGAEEAFDPMLKKCLKYFIKSKKASSSSLQGYFGIGYPKANKIVLQMERAGFVSAQDSSNRRSLFITEQEFEQQFGESIYDED